MTLPRRLGELLLLAGDLSRIQLDRALERQKRHGGRLGSHLLDLGLLDERQLTSALSRLHRIPAVGSGQLVEVDRAILALIGASDAIELGLMPLRRDGRRLWVAMCDPGDPKRVEAAAAKLGLESSELRLMVVAERTFEAALERHYQVPRRVVPVAKPVEVDLSEIEEKEGPKPPPLPMPVYDRSAAGSAFMEAVTQFLDQVNERVPEIAGPLSLGDLAWRLSAALNEALVVELGVRFLAPRCKRVVALRVESGWLRGWGALGPTLDGDWAPEGLVETCIQTTRVQIATVSPEALGRLAAPLAVHREEPAVLVPLCVAGIPEGLLVAFGLEELGPKELTALQQKLDLGLQLCRVRARLLS